MPPTTSTTDAQPPHSPHGHSGTIGSRTVARIGYGAMGLERRRDDPDTAVALVRRAIELGVDHIDTAQFYGNGFVNEVLRRAIRADDRVIIVSKVGATPNPAGPLPLRPAQRPQELRADVEENLRTLGLESIPVVNLRRLEVGPGVTATGDQVVDVDDQVAELITLRDQGKIGDFGISAIGTDTLRRVLPAGIVCVQNAYNLISREYEDMLQLCLANGVAWVPFFPLGSAFPGFPKVADHPAVRAAAQALAATPSQIGLAWLLGHAPNTLLIPGTATLEHLQENMAAGDLVLDHGTTTALDQAGAATITTGDRAPRWPAEAE